MDVDGIVRARRRQQALDALDFEHGREAAVLAQIDEVLTELEGARIDEAAFARMRSDDVALVRGVLDPGSDDPEDEFDLDGRPLSESRAEIRSEHEAERIRLEEVVADSRRRQQALERYIEALDAMDIAPDTAASLRD